MALCISLLVHSRMPQVYKIPEKSSSSSYLAKSIEISRWKADPQVTRTYCVHLLVINIYLCT